MQIRKGCIMSKYKCGDSVHVIPAVPGHWTDALRHWITGRLGTVTKCKPDGMYLIQFADRFPNSPMAGGSEWHAHESDLVRAKTERGAK